MVDNERARFKRIMNDMAEEMRLIMREKFPGYENLTWEELSELIASDKGKEILSEWLLEVAPGAQDPKTKMVDISKIENTPMGQVIDYMQKEMNEQRRFNSFAHGYFQGWFKEHPDIKMLLELLGHKFHTDDLMVIWQQIPEDIQDELKPWIKELERVSLAWEFFRKLIPSPIGSDLEE